MQCSLSFFRLLARFARVAWYAATGTETLNLVPGQIVI